MKQSFKENKAEYIVGVIAFLVAPIGLFAPKAMVPLIILAVLGLFAVGKIDRTTLKSLPKLPLVGFSLLIFWALLTSLWSVDPALSLKLILPLAAMFALGLTAVSVQLQNRSLLQNFIVWGVICAIALLMFEASTGNWLTRTGRSLEWIDIYDGYSSGYNVDALLKNGIVILTLLIWPTAAILWRRNMRLILAGLILALLYLALIYHATTSILALTIGCFFALAAFWSVRLSARILAGLFVIGMLATPLFTELFLATTDDQQIVRLAKSVSLPKSALNRLIIWKFVDGKIAEKPISGWGLNSSKNIPGGNEKYSLRDKSSDGGNKVLFADFYLPLHPHNNPLQIWLELGGVGAGIIALFGGLMIWRLGSAAPRHKPWIFGLIVSILMFDLLSFGVWQNWWIATQFLALALMSFTGKGIIDR